MGPMWPFLLMYASCDMRHTCAPQVDNGQQDPRVLGHHKCDVQAKQKQGVNVCLD